MSSLALIVITSLFFPGLIGRTKSLASGRKGPGVWQPLHDIVRLLRKGAVFSETTSFIFQMAPSIYLASIVAAVLLLPFDAQNGIFSFSGDFIFFAYLLTIGKFFMVLAALDTGSSFEGMGANREALYSMLVEPAFFVLLGALAMLTGHTSFQSIFQGIDFGSNVSYLLGLLATYIFVQIAMIENSRLPVDDPKTHLELTMVHEVMVLDHSGVDLAMIQYATTLKFAMYGMLIANFFFAPTFSLLTKVAVFVIVQVAFAITVGLLESFRARSRMRHNPQFIFTLTSIAVLVFFAVLIIMENSE
jgi:formate hydrogenlyase subunit 4